MNPNSVQTPAMTPQAPPVMPSAPQQATPQPTQPYSSGKSPQLPTQPFTPSHHHIYNTLRNNLMELVKAGVPGIEKVLAALNNSHVDGMKQQAQQPPQLPQQPTQGAMGGGGVGQAPPPSMMPQGGQ